MIEILDAVPHLPHLRNDNNGDVDKKTSDAIGLIPLIETKSSQTERHRTIKVWRALWKRMAALGYCGRDTDPSQQFSNSAPAPRKDVWYADEVRRLIKRAIRMGHFGLAALLAVAWDSQLSPVDARCLKPRQRREDEAGVWFDVERTKTGAGAIATLSKRSRRLLNWYLDQLNFQPHDEAPIFRTRGSEPGPQGGRPRPPVPYTKDRLSRDFAIVREAEFGKDETRQLQDIRRSGALEAVAGKADPGGMSKKMGNTIGSSNRLHRTYVPGQVAVVRLVDEARVAGRRVLREQKPHKSVIAPTRKV